MISTNSIGHDIMFGKFTTGNVDAFLSSQLQTLMHFYLLSFLHFYFFLLSIDHLEAFESAYRVNRSVLSG